ncbi:hypothetical protein MOVI109754_12290 [Moritella viscosa]|uniref:Uncharacterized protein n=1 Tax=Moritella viscosa TaxID=80854 RepID=A0A090IIW3_9GAMM|nr:putative uncharacterized protein [Moritella viscosa]SGZ06525.1 Putative uncharacterized protein [Moritella viscosa]SGZ06706.1 Putative uncharacterized protein [Moritella viscosa]SGZ14230.1 Putative uncharacterized protein [Moritella viscosa]SHO13855.1 Putative uncharacterized protein [Moritella viscosa]
MVNPIKLMLCDLETKSAESKNEDRDTEQIIRKMEIIIEELLQGHG